VLFIVACRDKSGSVETFRDLPRFGSALPALGEMPIAYRYDPRVERLLTRTRCTTNTFFALCTKMSLKITQYEQGFPGSDLVIDDSSFAPKGPRVWCGYGKLHPDGRAQVRAFFEPTVGGPSNLWGTLYLHVH
jgi:hypothetical protein